MANAIQVQQIRVNADMSEDEVYNINRAEDVRVDTLTDGELTLPGSKTGEMLQETLRNVRKFLHNLEKIAKIDRDVVDATSDNGTNLASTKLTHTLQDEIDKIKADLTNHQQQIDGKAPTIHDADAPTTYGGGTGTKYGHVKLSDNYASSETNNAAQYSLAASQKAVADAYATLNAAKAANQHAVANKDIYGGGTSDLFGHIKLTDNYKDETINNASTSIGASQLALHNAYKELKNVTDTHTTQINGKAPTVHSGTNAATYGAGNATNFGHVKLTDTLQSSENTASTSTAAAYSVAASGLALAHEYAGRTSADAIVGTASVNGHVKLVDNYTTNSNAATGIAASAAALKSSHDALQNSINTINNEMKEIKSGITIIFKHSWKNTYFEEYNLGSSITTQQQNDIRDGKFNEVNIGGYWQFSTSNGNGGVDSTKWYVAGCDYNLHCGDTELTQHHVIIVPDRVLGNIQMNTTNTTTGGYVGSDFYKNKKTTLDNYVKKKFGEDHVIKHRQLLTNSITGNSANGWAWCEGFSGSFSYFK